MKTMLFSILLAVSLGFSACSSSKQGQSGADTLGDTSGMGTHMDTTTSGTDTTRTRTDTSTTPRP